MNGVTNLTELIKGMTPKLNKGEYVFSTIKDFKQIKAIDTICTFKEKEGISVIIKRKKADKLKLKYDFVAAWITLSIHSSLEAVGLTAIFSNELAKKNISCNVISGYFHDHIFVDKKDAKKAMKLLKNLSANYS